MRPIRVNADYEMTLFEKKQSPAVVNQSLEFLAFYLEDRPVCSQKKYSDEFLSHVEMISGKKPQIVQTQECENWWGKLENVSLEQTLNSKELSASFEPDTQIISSLSELRLSDKQTYIAKNPFGMSGQNLIVFKKGEESNIEDLLTKTKKLVVEPFFERVFDFSLYVFPDGQFICYENLVDKNFQYKGTIFNDLKHPHISKLSFFNLIDSSEWDRYERSIENVIKKLKLMGASGGYSIDSFVYKTDEGIKIRPVCEINYRKTMGLMSWLLSQRYQKKSWSLFVLGKSLDKKNTFSLIQERVKTLSQCLYLSPGDTRFEMFLIGGESREDGLKKFLELKTLLPDCEFSV